MHSVGRNSRSYWY